MPPGGARGGRPGEVHTRGAERQRRQCGHAATRRRDELQASLPRLQGRRPGRGLSTAAGGGGGEAVFPRPGGAYRGSPPPLPARRARSRRAGPLGGSNRPAPGGRATRRRRSAVARHLFPVRPLHADGQLAPRGAAGEPARHLGGRSDAALVGRLPHQHQHPDELLARGSVQPLRVPRAVVRFHRHAAAAGPQDRGNHVRLQGLGLTLHDHRLGADGPPGPRRHQSVARLFRVAGAAPVGALRLHRRWQLPARARLAGAEGSCGVLS